MLGEDGGDPLVAEELGWLELAAVASTPPSGDGRRASSRPSVSSSTPSPSARRGARRSGTRRSGRGRERKAGGKPVEPPALGEQDGRRMAGERPRERAVVGTVDHHTAVTNSFGVPARSTSAALASSSVGLL